MHKTEGRGRGLTGTLFIILLTLSAFIQLVNVPAVSAATQTYYLNSALITGSLYTLSTSSGSADTSTSQKIAKSTGSYEANPYTSSSRTTGTPSEATQSNVGWEVNTGGDIASGTWTFHLTTTASSASGTAYIWITIWNCATNSGTCTFLFKNYDNTTNILGTTSATQRSYTTGTEPAFNSVTYLRVEYWIQYTAAGSAATATVTETTVSTASDVVAPGIAVAYSAGPSASLSLSPTVPSSNPSSTSSGALSLALSVAQDLGGITSSVSLALSSVLAVGNALNGALSGSLSLVPSILGGTSSSASAALSLGASLAQGVAGLASSISLSLAPSLGAVAPIAASLSASLSLSSAIAKGSAAAESSVIALTAAAGQGIGGLTSTVSTALSSALGVGASLSAEASAALSMSASVLPAAAAAFPTASSLTATLGQGISGITNGLSLALVPSLSSVFNLIQTISASVSLSPGIGKAVSWAESSTLSMAPSLNEGIGGIAQSLSVALTPVLAASAALSAEVSSSLSLVAGLGIDAGGVAQSVSVGIGASIAEAIASAESSSVNLSASLTGVLSLAESLTAALSLVPTIQQTLTGLSSNSLSILASLTGIAAISQSISAALSLAPSLSMDLAGIINSATLGLSPTLTTVAAISQLVSASLDLSPSVQLGLGAITRSAAIAISPVLSGAVSFYGSLAASLSLSTTLGQDIGGLAQSLTLSVTSALQNGITGVGQAASMALQPTLGQGIGGMTQLVSLSLSPLLSAITAASESLTAALTLAPGLGEVVGATESASLGLLSTLDQAVGSAITGADISLSPVLSITAAFASTVAASLSISPSLAQNLGGLTQGASVALSAVLGSVASLSESLTASLALAPATLQGIGGVAQTAAVSSVAAVDQGLAGISESASLSLSSILTALAAESQTLSASLSLVASAGSASGIAQSAALGLASSLGQDIGAAVQELSLSLTSLLSFTAAFSSTLLASLSVAPALGQDLAGVTESATVAIASLLSGVASLTEALSASLNLTPALVLNLGNVAESVAVASAASLDQNLAGITASVSLAVSPALSTVAAMGATLAASLSLIPRVALDVSSVAEVVSVTITSSIEQDLGSVTQSASLALSPVLTAVSSIAASLSATLALAPSIGGDLRSIVQTASVSLASSVDQAAVSVLQSTSITLSALLTGVSSLAESLSASLSLASSLNQVIGGAAQSISLSISAATGQGIAGVTQSASAALSIVLGGLAGASELLSASVSLAPTILQAISAGVDSSIALAASLGQDITGVVQASSVTLSTMLSTPVAFYQSLSASVLLAGSLSQALFGGALSSAVSLASGVQQDLGGVAQSASIGLSSVLAGIRFSAFVERLSATIGIVPTLGQSLAGVVLAPVVSLSAVLSAVSSAVITFVESILGLTSLSSNVSVVVAVGQAASLNLAPTMTALSSTALQSLTLGISSNQGPIGTVVKLMGTGYLPTQIFSYCFESGITSTPTACSGTMQFTTDSSGEIPFGTALPIPSGASTGLVVVSIGGIVVASKLFTVSSANVQLVPGRGAPGIQVAVRASGLTHSHALTVSIDNATLSAACYTDSTGAATCSITLPTTMTVAPHVITVSDGTNTVSGTFLCLAASASVTPSVVPPGSSVTITGSAFVASSHLAVSIDGSQIGTSGSCSSDNSGSLETSSRCSFIVPASLSAGSHTVAVSDGTSSASASLTVASPSLTLPTSSGPAGSSVALEGFGFIPTHAYYSCFETGVTTNPTACSATKKFVSSISGTIPSSVLTTIPAGSSTGLVVVTDSVSDNVIASAIFTVQSSVIQLSPSTGPPGVSVVVTGSSLPPSAALTLKYDGTPVSASGSCTTDASGDLPASNGCAFEIPTSSTAGAHVVTASASSTIASGGFLVSAPSITLTPSQGPAGTRVTLAGSGFSPGVTVTVSYSGNSVATSPSALKVTSAGTFTATITIPASSGSNTVRATGGDAGSVAADKASSTFTITTPTISVTPSSGSSGTFVTLTGSNLAPDYTYYYCFESGVTTSSAASSCGSVYQLTTDDSGNMPQTPGVPIKASDQTGWFVLTDPKSNSIVAHSAFSVTTNTSNASISLTPTTGTLGTPVTVSGEGFPANALVNIIYTGGVTVATATSTGSGAFTATFDIPPSTAGSNILTASSAGVVASANLVVSNLASSSTSFESVSAGLNGTGSTSVTLSGDWVNVTSGAPGSSIDVAVSALTAPSYQVPTISNANNTAYYDIQATVIGASSSSEAAMLCITVTGFTVTSSTTLQYYDGSTWMTVQSTVNTSTNSVCTSGSIPVSSLSGTNFVVSSGTSAGGGGGGGVSNISINQVQLTGQPGTPTAAFTLTGCNVDLGTIEGNGQWFTVQALSGCSLTLAPAPTGSNYTRFVFASGSTSLTFTTCPAGTPVSSCGFSAQYWYQLRVTYQMVAKGQSSFDDGLTLSVRGAFTSSSSTVCSVTTTASTGGTASCGGWSDADSAVNFLAFGTAPGIPGRWAARGQTSFTDGAPSTHAVTYYKQYPLAVEGGSAIAYSLASPTGDSYWDSGTLLNITSSGVWGRADGVGTRAASWRLDYGARTAVATAGRFSASGIEITSTHTLHIDSVAQYQVALTGTCGSESLTSPSLPGDTGWFDSETFVTLTCAGTYGRESGVGTRLDSYSVNGGPQTIVLTVGAVTILDDLAIASPQSVALTAVVQYQLVLAPTTGGTIEVTPVSAAPGDYGWFDAGARVSLQFTPFAGNATSVFNWSGQGMGSYSGPTNPTTITMNGFVTEMVLLSPRAVVRISLTMSSSGSPATWAVSGCGLSKTLAGDGTLNQFIALPSCTLTISHVNGGDTRYVFADGTSSTSLVACANGYCQPVSVRYYFQSALRVSYASVGAPPPVPPTFSYLALGSHRNATLSQSPASIWSDFGAKWSFTQTIQVGSSERWSTTSETVGTTAGPTAISPLYYHQYLLNISYSIIDGGTYYTQPRIASTRGGVQSDTALGGQAAVWVDAGTAWSCTATLTSSVPGEEWLAQNQTSGNATRPETIAIAYQHLMLAVITQEGLPAGELWSIIVGGKSYNVTKQSMTLLLPPGKYSWSIETPPVVNSTTVFAPANPTGTLNLTSGGATLDAQFSNLIVATVQVGKTSASATSVEQGFNATVTKTGTEVAVAISSSNSTGPRVLILDVASGALGSDFPSGLTILVDGTPVQRASSFLQLLDVTQTAPLYATTATADGYEVTIYLPHMTSHTVVLQVPAPNPILSLAGNLPLIFLLAAFAAALGAILLRRGGKKGPEKVPRPPKGKKEETWT